MPEFYSDVTIVRPAPDGNGTSVVIDGVEMNTKILAGSLKFESRAYPQPPLLTVGLALGEFTVSSKAEVVVDERTAALLLAAGWTAPADTDVMA